jgi:hypothetical protein
MMGCGTEHCAVATFYKVIIIPEMPTGFVFPMGYHAFHGDPLFNFHLNRWHSLGYARHEDMEAAGSKATRFVGWKPEMLALGAMSKWIGEKSG